MNSAVELELVLDSELDAEAVETLHIICGRCHALVEPFVTLCGVFEDREREEDVEYLHCAVCFDLFEVGVCSKGHVLY